MLGFNLQWSQVLTFLPACMALLTVLTPARYVSFGLLLMSLMMGLWFNYLTPTGLVWCLALIVSAASFKLSQSRWLRRLSGVAVMLIVSMMLLHILPGFNNPKVIDQVVLSEGAVSFTKYLNIDKIVVAIVLLLLVVPAPVALSGRRLIVIALWFIAISALSFSVALLSGLAAIDVKLPTITAGWLLTNLFFTCYAEEAFFRGFVQQQLYTLSQRQYWPYAVILISGCLFGLAHFPAGAVYTVIASLTGCLYAYSYWRTQHILVPIMLHFLFNCVHFFFFTYPYFAPPA